MKISIILGSQRKGGTAAQIEDNMRKLNLNMDVGFIRMSELKVEGCIACEKCSKTGRCILPPSGTDMFENVLNRLIASDVIMLITPIYSPYPSRLIALLERLLSISFFVYRDSHIQRPLKGKKTAIICYGSSKIEDEKPLKLLFQKYLMDDYSFFEVTYDYINNVEHPHEKYSSVIEYVNDILINHIKINVVGA